MSRLDAKMDVRLDKGLKKEMVKLARKCKCTLSDVGRAGIYLGLSEYYTDEQLGFGPEDMPHLLALFVLEQLEKRKKNHAA